MSIGSVLSELLKKFNLNALELERLTGIPSSTIYRLLKNNGNPTIEVLKKLASFFQITVSQLIGEEHIGGRQIPLIYPDNIGEYIVKGNSSNQKKISIDFPMNIKCFATLVEDNMMEPFILTNSIVIVDPEKKITHKDFILVVKNKSERGFIRQFIDNGEEHFLKVINSDFPNLKQININDYFFCGSIVHYRTNIFNYEQVEIKDFRKKVINLTK
ncbi:HTH-type transcriptional regulator [Legionella adelaidensis]|uniref:HTH-type transcriptional regulator n=1 Tax=Legionella adelaidensis TaxID=45056 RepID=A0A0W0R1A0_9GAMM|nr:helix-turn-helix domain-containing protein [Legionella adelaidensis]KTC64729.1 HTH-type transcriptional regulator [Legionella adelaidensis]